MSRSWGHFFPLTHFLWCKQGETPCNSKHIVTARRVFHTWELRLVPFVTYCERTLCMHQVYNTTDSNQESITQEYLTTVLLIDSVWSHLCHLQGSNFSAHGRILSGKQSRFKNRGVIHGIRDGILRWKSNTYPIILVSWILAQTLCTGQPPRRCCVCHS